jgi:CheY-like chemotaxis protein
MAVRQIRLIHWSLDEAQERAQRITEAGYDVDFRVPAGASFLRELGNGPPAAVVIDLSRLPSQGRDVALMIRKRRATRQIPLIFVGGDPRKVERIRALLPDAAYSCWERIGRSLEDTIAHPPGEPVVPRSSFEAYVGRPLSAKLGIKVGSAVALVGAPQGFRETLGELPHGARLLGEAQQECDLTLWFVRSVEELERGIGQMSAQAHGGPLWIAWPKRASSIATDLSQQHVREMGLAARLVDYKICSIDKTWSGLLFTRRKPRA